MNLYMSSGEYQALMKEMGYASSGSSSPKQGSAPTGGTQDVMLGQLTLRLDEKWERFTANLALQVLELARELVDSVRIVAYASAACLVLYGTSCIIRALRDSASSEKEHGQAER